MKRLLTVLLFCCSALRAQVPGAVTFVANHLTMGAGSTALPNNSQVCVLATDALDRPAGYALGGGGQTTGSSGMGECHPVLNGAVTPFTVLNSAASSPLNACLRVSLLSPSGAEVRRDRCVQTGTAAALATWCSIAGGVETCDYSKYPIGTAPVSQVQLGPPGPKGDSGCTNLSNCSGNFNPTVVNGNVVHAQAAAYAGTSVDQQLTSAGNASAGSTVPITFVVDAAGTVAAPVNLAAGNSLLINASITFGAGAVINLYGSNRVSCAQGVTLSSSQPGQVFFASSANNLEIDHCRVQTTGGNGPALLHVNGSSHVRVHDGTFSGAVGALVGTGIVSDVEVRHNSFDGAASGMYLSGRGTTDVRFVENTCVNGTFCGDINVADAPTIFATQTRASTQQYGGRWSFLNNHCTNVFSCVWSGPGVNVVFDGNVCRNTGDQCVDAEGAVGTRMTNNTCYNDATVTGGAGLHSCASLFQFSDDALIANNHFTAENGAPLIALKNNTGDPTFSFGVTIQGNTLKCYSTACNGLYTEAESQLKFVNNVLQDAAISVGYGTVTDYSAKDILVSGNKQWFTLPSGCAICIKAAVGRIVVENNTTDGPAIMAAGSAGIRVNFAYFNGGPDVIVTANKLFAGFPTDIEIHNESGNNGVGLNAELSENWLINGTVTFVNPNGRPGQLKELSRYVPGDGSWKRLQPILAGAGNNYLCVDASGRSYRSSTACQ